MDIPFQHKLRALFAFRKTIRKLNPDITVYTWVMGAFLAAFSGWKGRSIYEAHRARPTMKHQWIVSLMERRVDAVVALTQQDADGYPNAKRVVQIPNFTSLHVEKPSDCLSKPSLIRKASSAPSSRRSFPEKPHPSWHGSDDQPLLRSIRLSFKCNIITGLL